MDVFTAVSEVGLNVGAILAIGVEDARYSKFDCTFVHFYRFFFSPVVSQFEQSIKWQYSPEFR